MGRSPCCDKSSVKKGPWAPEEDAKLKDFIEKFGTGGNWISLPQKAGLRRCGKSCRLRWLNYLRPNIKHGEFSEEEDRIICTLYASIGSRWSIIAAHLPGRTDNDIKNYWNTKLKKKLMGFASPDQAKSPAILTSPAQSQLPISTFSQLYSSFFTQPTKPLPPIDPSQNYLYNTTNTTNTSFPFQHNQFSYITNQESLFVDFQGYNAGKDQNMLIFGANEASCSNSSNGSCGYGKDHVIKQEQMGCIMDQDCNLIDPLSAFVGQKVDYDLEEVKEQIGIHGSCDNNFLYYY